MRRVEFVVKNYRCFPEQAPLRLTLTAGFTAFIGPNNSGKSTALKLFHEMRGLFSLLSQYHVFQQFVVGQVLQNPVNAVEDQREVFSNTSLSALVFELSIASPGENELSRVVLRCERQSVNYWTGEFFVGPAFHKAVANANIGGALGFVLADRREVVVDCEWLLALGKAISGSIYIGPFRNAISEGRGTYYDLEIGTAFIELWDRWKTGPVRAENDIAQDVTRKLETLFGYQRLEINASVDKLTLQAVVNGKSYRLRELGAGLAQFLVVVGNVAIKRPTLLLIDEPELNLHPALQATFLATLASYVSEGVIFATHSIGLARSTAESIYSFQRLGDYVRVRQFAQMEHLAEFLGEMSFSAYRELGYTTVLLVEGVSELKTMQAFLRKLGKDKTIIVLPLGGSNLINDHSEHELAELKRLCDKVVVMIDSERDSATSDLATPRRKFLEACASLGIPAMATSRRSTENYLTENAIRAVKGPAYRALLPYEQLKSLPLAWAKHENWKIATAMSMDDLGNSDVATFLRDI